MPGIPTLVNAVTSRLLPQPVDRDGSEAPTRLNRYREQITQPAHMKMHSLADEGAYFVAMNATPGTKIDGPIVAAFLDTVPFLYVYNKESPGGKSIFLDYMKYTVWVAPASGVQAFTAIKLDNGERNLSTDNTVALTPVSTNSALGVQSVARIQLQNTATNSAIAGASKNARVVHHGGVGGIPVVGDELGIVFGSAGLGCYNGLTAAQSGNPGRKYTSAPPVIIGPGTNMVLHLWFPSNAVTGASYEFEMGYWER